MNTELENVAPGSDVIVGFDFTQVPEDKRNRAIQLDYEWDMGAQTAHETLLDLGRIANRMREILTDEQFRIWYVGKGVSKDKVYRWMRKARGYYDTLDEIDELQDATEQLPEKAESKQAESILEEKTYTQEALDQAEEAAFQEGHDLAMEKYKESYALAEAQWHEKQDAYEQEIERLRKAGPQPQVIPAQNKVPEPEPKQVHVSRTHSEPEPEEPAINAETEDAAALQEPVEVDSDYPELTPEDIRQQIAALEQQYKEVHAEAVAKLKAIKEAIAILKEKLRAFE